MPHRPSERGHGRTTGARPVASGRPDRGRRQTVATPARSQGRTRSIEEEIRSSARPGRGDPAVRAFQEAVSLLERGRDVPAAAAALRAKDLAPRSGAVREVVGIALYRAGRFQEALRELQAYRRMTGRLDQNHLIADSHRALGQPQKAVEPVREALGARISEEARAEAAVVGASALADLGRYPEALSLLRSFPARDRLSRPHELRLWYVAGDILERAGRPREAAEEFRRVVRHDPQAFDAAERLAALA